MRRLEDTILRHASRIRGITDSYSSAYGGPASAASSESTKRPDYLHTLDKRVTEADAYLQLMIEHTTRIERTLAAHATAAASAASAAGTAAPVAALAAAAATEDVAATSLANSTNNTTTAAHHSNNSSGAGSNSSRTNDTAASDTSPSNRRIVDNANAMLDSIKHSIVLLQIAKNTAHPINGIYHGPGSGQGLHMKAGQALDASTGEPLMPPGIPAAQTGIMYGAECLEKCGGAVQAFVPETSYSSSEGEDDFFDANDDPYSSQEKTASL